MKSIVAALSASAMILICGLAKAQTLDQQAKCAAQARIAFTEIIFDLRYREYCRARLAEMRKQLLIRPESHEVPEANCYASRPDCAADRGGSRLDDSERKAAA
jgi:hypothetical protein